VQALVLFFVHLFLINRDGAVGGFVFPDTELGQIFQWAFRERLLSLAAYVIL